MEEKKISKLSELWTRIKELRSSDSRLSLVWSGSGKVTLTRKGEPRSPVCTVHADWDNETLLADIIAAVSALLIISTVASLIKRVIRALT